MLSQSDGTNPGSIHYADINASYDIDSLNLLSASFGGHFYKLNVQGDSRTSLSNSSNDILYRFNNHYWMPGYSHHSWNGRLDYEHKTRRKGERLMSLSRACSQPLAAGCPKNPEHITFDVSGLTSPPLSPPFKGRFCP